MKAKSILSFLRQATSSVEVYQSPSTFMEQSRKAPRAVKVKRTSLEAYQSIIDSGKTPILRVRVLHMIHHNRDAGCTQLDISAALGESARKRIAELVQEGVVFEVGTKKINNLNYTVYSTNNRALFNRSLSCI